MPRKGWHGERIRHSEARLAARRLFPEEAVLSSYEEAMEKAEEQAKRDESAFQMALLRKELVSGVQTDQSVRKTAKKYGVKPKVARRLLRQEGFRIREKKKEW